jgi:threonine synthase
MARGDERIDPWHQAQTSADGLRVPGVFADLEVLEVLRSSKGTAVAVTEAAIAQAQQKLSRQEGVLASREGAATLAGLFNLVETVRIQKDERIVLFNTASGLKEFV